MLLDKNTDFTNSEVLQAATFKNIFSSYTGVICMPLLRKKK